MIGDLSNTADSDALTSTSDTERVSSKGRNDKIPTFSVHELEGRELGLEPALSNDEEDILLKDTTGSFADWVTSFVRRVIQLLENLPDEGANGTAGGATEGEAD